MANQPTPCSWCPKQPLSVPDGERSPSTAVELSDANFLAYRHHGECAAVGDFPADDVVRRNAGVIRRIEKDAEAVQGQLAALSAFARRE